MKESLTSLHERFPYDEDERYWSNPIPLQKAIQEAGDLHLQADPLTYLDDILESDRRRARAIGQALLFLPPEVVIDSYGDDVALWTSLTTYVLGENKDMYTALKDIKGYDIDSLEVARGWVWRNSTFESRAKPVLAQYKLMKALQNGITDQIDLPSILKSSAKDGVSLSAKRINDYEIAPIETESYNDYYDGGHVKGWSDDENKNLAYKAWLDAPSGFALMYKGVPNAMAGIAMRGMDEVMVHQLQGVQALKIDPSKNRYSDERVVGKVSSRGLMPIDWQKVLIDTTEQIAGSLAIRKTGIQAGKNNVWTKLRMRSDTEPHLSVDNAIKAYDVPAERLGYVKDPTDKANWHKKI